MKIVFAGTPDFAAAALEAVCGAGHDVTLVLTQPDRASGRGMRMTPSAVKTLALSRGLAVSTPLTLSVKKGGDEALKAHEEIAAASPDLLVVAAYGLIIPQAVLDIPRGIGKDGLIKAINIHASLLPRWRGAAPAARAIEAGDSETGVCLMRMEAGLDTGGVILRKTTPIGEEDTTATLTSRLARIGAGLLVQALASPDSLSLAPQSDDGMTYARKVEKSESRIDWNYDAAVISRRIRAFDPFPSCSSTIRSTVIKFWKSEALLGDGRAGAAPGTVLSTRDGLVVAAGGGSALRATVLQRPGKPRMDWKRFLQGFQLKEGETFL